jgi:hypothetical protein
VKYSKFPWKDRLHRLKSKLTALKKLRLKRLTRKQRLIIGASAGAILTILFLCAVFVPQQLPYSFAQKKSCVSSPRLLSGLSTISVGGAYRVYREGGLAIGGFSLYSSSICADSTSAPVEKRSYAYRERLIGLGFLGRTITVGTPAFPVLTGGSTQKRSVPPDAPLKLELSQVDKAFGYTLILDDTPAAKTSTCKTEEKTLSCDLAPLGLTYAQTYSLTIIRTYQQKRVSAIGAMPIQTITPVGVASTSIAPGSVVLEKPTQIIVEVDKTIKSLGTVQLVAKQPDGTESVIPATASFAGDRVVAKLGQELPRRLPFELRLASIEATDGSGFQAKSFVLPFSTSGGPRVKNANIGKRNVATGQTITVTLDQPLLAVQDIGKNVQLTVNGARATATYTIQGDKIHIKPASEFPLCAPFSVTINKDIQSQFGISGDSGWSTSSRAICYSTFSIGRSVQGRTITAYRLGNGPDLIVYMGAMHGSEANSKNIMAEWFSELNAGAEKIPAHRSIVIIPAVNPDGVAAGTRFNARGVDLNRNFPANDWKSVVTTPGGSGATPAGGPSPLSEPESQAIAAYIRSNSPRLVMSFHSKAAVVEANEAGDSVTIANGYASRSRYRAVPKSQSAPVFQYDTTGAMEDWMRDKLDRPAIVVELATSSSSEFGRNRDALWYTVGL